MHKAFSKRMERFRNEEDGVAMTEYLVLLGVLVGAVIASILFYGEQLGGVFVTWATWLGALLPS